MKKRKWHLHRVEEPRTVAAQASGRKPAVCLIITSYRLPRRKKAKK